MLNQAIRKRRKECSPVLFVAFMLGCVALVALPGLLYFYFWEGAGFILSTFIGFLLGSFALSLLEGMGHVLAAIRRLFGKPAGPKASEAESQREAEDA